jgi:DNA-binding transcriptional MocR family regulator
VTVQNYISGDSAVNIARSIEQAVTSGRAGAGQKLPAVRALAAQLGVSPATVAAAYRTLQDRGITAGDGRRGTRIRPSAPVSAPAAPPMPEGVRDLSAGNPDLPLLPALEIPMRKAGAPQRLYDDALNDPRLLKLGRAQFEQDGIDGEHLAVVSGALDGVERVLREHLRAGDRVAVEDPCFTGILDLLAALSLVPVPFTMDDEGPRPDSLADAVRAARALIVTPRAQNPTGAALTPRRARQLRTVLARKPDLLLVEDDHAGPVAGAPHLTLSGGRERWAVVRSVSKSLGPDLRLALLAGDAETIARVEGRQSLGIRWVSHLLQRLVAQLWSDRNVHRLLGRASATYAARRQALLRELTSRGIEAHGVSGLNVWIPVPEETTAVQALLAAGWAVNPGARYRIATPPAIRITTAGLLPADAAALADDLALALIPRRSARA